MTRIIAPVAKITWNNEGAVQRFLLTEGATVSIGRADSCDVCIREQHVSRQHAVISYRDGVFVIADLNSANGVYVNDERIEDGFPLIAGDVIRLFVPILTFEAVNIGQDDGYNAEESRLITATDNVNKAHLIVSNGVQEGTSIPLTGRSVTIGRASATATWDVLLQDPSVSRPHARIELVEDVWAVYDLGSSNGTMVNGIPINEKGRALADGDVVSFGSSVLLFRMN